MFPATFSFSYPSRLDFKFPCSEVTNPDGLSFFNGTQITDLSLLGPAHYNKEIFVQQTGGAVQYSLPGPHDQMTSADYLHQHARLMGRYPKLGLFSEYDEPEDRTSPTSSYEASVSDSSDSYLHTPDEQNHNDFGTVYTSNLSDTSIAEMSPRIEPFNLLKRKASSVSFADFEPLYEDTGNDASDSEGSSAGSEYRERSVEPSASHHRLASNVSLKKRKLSKTARIAARTARSSPSPSSSSSNDSQLTIPEGSTIADRDPSLPYYEVRGQHGKYFQCRLCPQFRSTAIGDMGRHLESLIHSPPSYVCDPGCGKAFTRKDALVRHTRRGTCAPGGRKGRKPKKKAKQASDDDSDF